MKILSVIPARAGSKGIPNKNIRIIGGKPLICYSIDNALKSKYITDIIVTTDSEEVRIIASQMNIKCRRRSSELCEDDVTLDAVVYDASRGYEWDYVITLQPTSPTLTSETLDKAIEYSISNNIDTLISAINTPHLSWSKKGGKLVPNYEKRLNRQFLPPCYMETGAFMISKGSVITENSRIGSSVEIFEIPEIEAYDIDTFSDLQNVAVVLEKEKVAIYVNGNNQRGLGHIYRALEIADEFYLKPDIYYDINQTNVSVFGKTTHNLIAVNGISELYEKCKTEQYSIFINDILSTSSDYMLGLKNVLPNAKIINFEDDGEGAFKADLVFNALYCNSKFPNIFSGERYYIAGKTFLLYKPIKISEKVKNVFISFGGSDPQDYTDRLLEIICRNEYSHYNFTVVIGRAKQNADSLMQYNKFSNINVLYDVSNMPQLMSECDIALTSRGRTGYELALLGIPSIAMAQNKREEKHGFVCNENGFTYIGLNPDNDIIESNLKMYLNLPKKARQHFQDLLLSHDLRGGRKRVMNLIKSL